MASFYTGTGPGADLYVAAVVRSFVLSLADRDTSILTHPAISAFYKDTSGWNALAEQVAVLGFGGDLMSAYAEGGVTSETEISGEHPTISVAQYRLSRVISDFARALDATGAADYATLAQDGLVSWQRTLIDLIAGLLPSCTASVNATGTALTWSHVRQALGTLGIAHAPGPYVGVFRERQWDHLSADALTLGGAVAQAAETQRYMGANGGLAYKGRFFNGQLDVFTSDGVDTSGADYVGGIFGPGFMGWRTATATPSPASHVLLAEGPFLCEAVRSNKGEDEIVSWIRMGVGIVENARGVKIISKQAA